MAKSSARSGRSIIVFNVETSSKVSKLPITVLRMDERGILNLMNLFAK